MRAETGYFTSFDGCRLFYRSWRKSADSALLIVHGLGEHSGRYDELASFLSELSVSIFAFDLRGHGNSDGPRAFAEDFEQLTKDLKSFRTLVQRDLQPNITRFFVLGQSLGGLIATKVVLDGTEDWDTLILWAPFFGIPFGHAALSVLCSILDLIVPRMIWDNPVPAVYLTHDVEELARYRSDALVQRRITIHLAREMFLACRSVGLRAEEITLTLVVMAAGDDRIVSLKRTISFFNRCRSQNKTLKVFDGFFHELLHERERAKPMMMLKEELIRRGL